MDIVVFPVAFEVASPALTRPLGGSLLGFGRVPLMALLVVLMGCPRHTGPDTTLPLVTTDNRAAEDEVRAAREAADAGRIEEGVQRYEAYLATYPNDALRPIAQLGLGRLRLAQGQNTEALQLFDEVARHADPAIAERGRFYVGVTRHLMGEHAVAIRILEPLQERTVDAEETVLLLRTLAASALATNDMERAVTTLDALCAQDVSDADKREAEVRLREILATGLPPDTSARLYDRLPHTGVAWPMLARGGMRSAFDRGDLVRVRALARALSEAGETLEPDLAAMAVRAERTGSANPMVIGALLPLSGRGQEAGQAALRGMALAIGSPPTGPIDSSDFQIIHRDIGDAPSAAVAAVDELVTLHRVIAIVGPIGSEAAAMAAARAEALGVPMITLSPTGDLETRSRYIFRILPSVREEVRELLRNAVSPSTRRVAVVHASHGYGRAIRDAVASEVVALGGEWAGAAEYTPGITAFEEVVRQTVSQRPDIVILGDGPSAVALLAPALAASGLIGVAPGQVVSGSRRAIVVLLPSLAFDASLTRTSARYLQGARVARPFDPSGPLQPAAARFRDDFVTRYGEAPSLLAAYAFDAISIIQSRVEAGSTTRESMAAALAGFHEPMSVGSSNGFTSERSPQRPTQVLRLSGNQWVAVTP